MTIQRSICSTCTHNGKCLLQGEGNKFSCEEFSNGARENGIGFRLEESDVLIEKTSNVPPPKGLCSTCDNLPTCLLPKHQGGVWHCEEYI